MSSNFFKWIPAFVVPAVVVAAVVAVPLQAGAVVSLPSKTPEQVLLLVHDSAVSAFSGSVTQSSDLGLPNLNIPAGMTDSMQKSMDQAVPPGGKSVSAAGALTTAMELLSGSHDARVFVDGASQTRVQIKDRMAERNVVRNGKDVWLYDSKSNEATHLSIPANLDATAKAKAAALEAQLPADLSTPAQLADRFLSDVDPSTTVSVGTNTRVAGRSVYQLMLTPKSTDTLVTSVSISVDSETGLPLKVTVLAKGQSAPALQVGFTSIDFSAPEASLFDFVPPASATVTEQILPALPSGAEANHGGDHNTPKGATPLVTGSGWSSIVEIPASTVSTELGSNPLVGQVTEAVDGGRALTTSLLSIFMATDGRIFAGAVPLAQLQAAAQ